MIRAPLKKGFRETLISGAVSVMLMTGLLAYLIVCGYLFAANIDERIESAARKSYVFQTYLKGDDILIRSYDGFVTLAGTVAEEFHMSLAMDTVSDLPGIKSVFNRLEVKKDIPGKNPDTWMRIKVLAMLMLHGNMIDAITGVQVRDGRVTLQGEAGSGAEKELTSEYIMDMAGVKAIRNEMTVARQPRKKNGTAAEFVDDSSIKAQVKLALAFHRSIIPFRATITVRKGTVTVSGMAMNAAEKEWVGKRLADIHGVARINNRLSIE